MSFEAGLCATFGQSVSISNRVASVIGHFTAMVADRNYRLGCAASTYTETGKDYSSFLFACNFAFTNVLDQPIYTDCAKAGTDCATGANPKYPNLCSTSEKYKVTFF
uniref:SCP domain-containing protein n=1 Tax=Musca domestica TaxID=7370 RepID=A0A1I8NAP4_MUSDO